MKENYHTHTIRCRHASGTEREYIETAISRGIRVLGFSDHSPQIFPGEYYSGFRMRPEEADEYCRTLSALREEYHRDIDIKIGFEAEYYPEVFEKLIKFLKPYGIDYLILGQHYIDNEYDTGHGSYSRGNDEAALEKYVNQCLEGLSTGSFTYLAHPDMFIYTEDDEVYDRHFRRLCEGAKKLNIPLEINFLGLGTGRSYPSEKFFAIAKEVGNDFIFGADAHAPQDVCKPEALALANQFAAKLGITPLKTVSLRKI